MRCGVGRVFELAGDEAVFDLLCQLVRLGNGTGHALSALCQDKLCTVSLEHIAALYAHGLGHGQDDAVAARGCDRRQPNAGVAAGGLNDRCAGLQCAARLSVVDHGDRNAVLDRTGRIEVFELGKDLCTGAGVLRKMARRIQRGVADQLGKAVLDIRHGMTTFLKY